MNKKERTLTNLTLNLRPVVSNQQLRPLKSASRLGKSTRIKIEEGREYDIHFEEIKADLGATLGQGRFGTVKKWLHRASATTFAVKMIDDRHLYEGKNGELMDIEIGKRVGDACPYLTKFFGALHAESNVWILTELMDTSLDTFYTKSLQLQIDLPELFISKVTNAVLTGLLHMKSLNLMHRDIKPSNILLSSRGDIKLCDFGISGCTVNSIFHTFVGCSGYMAPERTDISPAGYTIKADIWSLGITLIEIATGEHPFSSHDSQSIILPSLIIYNDPPKLETNKHSQDLTSFVSRCLVKNPDERADCEDLLKDEFIVKYLQTPDDLAYMQKIIDAIKSE